LPRPIDPGLRAAILTDIKTGQKNRNQIARERGVSPGTVTNIAKAEGITSAFDRTKTQNATRAKQLDDAAARAEEVELLRADVMRLRERAWSEYTQIVQGRDGAELVTTKLPPLRDQQAAYTSIAICIDKAEKLRQMDTGTAPDHAKSMLGKLMAGLADAFGDETDIPQGDG
jgi:hypothetical protein